MNIFWFRRDLRLGDNRAFYELAKFEDCGAIYIHDVILQSQDDFSSLHRDFIDESLIDGRFSFASLKKSTWPRK